MKALRIEKNLKGKRYALVKEPTGFSVWTECENYASHVRGGIAKTWRYVERHLPEASAVTLFNKRVGGKK